MSLFLKPLELAYRGAAVTVRKLYRRGLLKRCRLPRPVVSVGNISFGGSGKTPVTIAVAEELKRRGNRVAVLTRGYRRTTGEIELVAGRDADRYGDEPVVIAGRLPGVPVMVGTDRHAAGLRLLETTGCDVFVLDDGFQHHRLFRDLDVVIDDPGAAFLREGRRSLKEADIILAREGSTAETEFRLTLQPVSVVSGSTVENLASLRGKRALLFAGLAQNERFFAMCRNLEVDVVTTRGFPDHYRYTPGDIESLRATAKATMSVLLTTEKDSVKIGGDVSFVRVEAVITPKDRFFERVEAVLGRR